MALSFPCPLTSDFFENVRRLRRMIGGCAERGIPPLKGWKLMRHSFMRLSDEEWESMREEIREETLIRKHLPQRLRESARRVDRNGGM